MNVGILHLSDIHADRDWNYGVYVEEISKQINAFGFKKLFLAISGDLTQSGSIDQFDIVNNFMDALKASLSINDCEVDFVFVPGNHDISYEHDEKRERSVLLNLTDVEYFKNLDKELEKFKEYYTFSQIYGLPDSFIEKDQLQLSHIDFKILLDLNLRFYLLNNVVYSTYKATKDDNSCGVTHVPSSLIESIKLEPNTINILMMHFPYYYLDEITLDAIKEKMPLISYILTGHIHKNEYINLSSEKYLCSISSSAALYKEKISRLGISLLSLDTDTKKIERFAFTLTDRKTLVRSDKTETSAIRLISGINPLLKKDEFFNDLLYTGYDGYSLNDYFVFPELFSEKSTSSRKISDFDSFVNCLDKKQTIVISGGSQSGKTTLINKLFFDLDSIGIPIILDGGSFGELTKDKLSDFVKSSLLKQYEDEYSYRIFFSIPKDKRIALVDNYVIDGNSKQSLTLLSENFGKIVLLTSGTNYGITQLESIAMKSLLNDTVSFYELQPMFKQKRYELIEKRYRLLVKGDHRTFDDGKLNTLYQKVETILDKYVGSDSNYPYFINKVVISVLDDTCGLTTQNNRIYSRVYEAYIRLIIFNIFPNPSKGLVALELLKILAYDLIKNDSYSLAYDRFHILVNNFFETKKLRGVDPDEITNKLLNKKVIIKNDSNHYAFGSFDFLSYFAASYFSDLLNNDFEGNKKLIDEFIDKSYDETVSRFLLFVVSLANKKTALYLIDLAEDFVKDFEDCEIVNEEIALNDKEFKYLHKLTKKDRESLRERINEKEAERYEEQKEDYKNSVDNGKTQSSDENIRRLCKCNGFMDIISSMLPDLKVVIDGVDQDRCIKILYKLPVIFYRMGAGPLADHYKEVSIKLVEILGQMGKKVSTDAAESIVVNYCRAYFLASTNHVFRRAHSSITEQDLIRKDFLNNDTKKLMRLMSSMHDENAEETFEKLAKDYFAYFKENPFARNCISLMVRNYVSWYLSEEKAVTKKEFLKLFLKDDDIVEQTIEANLKDKEKFI